MSKKKCKGLTQKVSFCFSGRVKFRKVMLEKLNPSHSCGAGPSSQGHGRPWFSLCYPPEPLHRNLKIWLFF